MVTVRLAANLFFNSVRLAAMCFTSTIHVHLSEDGVLTRICFLILIKVTLCASIHITESSLKYFISHAKPFP